MLFKLQNLFICFRQEAKIRAQNERLSRAEQKKEAELKTRFRERHEKELLRQKAVLDRRCAQLEKEKAKKAVSYYIF